MTDTRIDASALLSETTRDATLIWLGVAAVAFLGTATAVAAMLGGGAPAVVLAASMALAGVTIGHLLERRRSARAAKAARMLMFRVADELAQYRAFTRLLRDQGSRIIESTTGAATAIVAGLNEMDATVSRMRILADRVASDDVPEFLASLEAVGAPVVEMLGLLQFQDVTQQQIAFLSRLSLLLDDHMTQLAAQLGDRRSRDRIDRFKEMFDEALGDCVMDSQRDDHHAASGLELREDTGLKLQMF
jgi:predicted RNA-binding Zn ribbon-like protein